MVSAPIDFIPPPGLEALFGAVGGREPIGSDGKATSGAAKRLYRHQAIPKRMNLEEAYKGCGSEEEPTTLMIRNIPNRYTQPELVSELEGLGFADSFDFFYLPVDRHSSRRRRGVSVVAGPGTAGAVDERQVPFVSSVGYAFVNFTDPEAAQSCMEVMQGYVFKVQGANSSRAATVSVAHIQGLEANLAHYRTLAMSSKGKRQQLDGPLVKGPLGPQQDLTDAAPTSATLKGQEPAKVNLSTAMKKTISAASSASSFSSSSRRAGALEPAKVDLAHINKSAGQPCQGWSGTPIAALAGGA